MWQTHKHNNKKRGKYINKKEGSKKRKKGNVRVENTHELWEGAIGIVECVHVRSSELRNTMLRFDDVRSHVVTFNDEVKIQQQQQRDRRFCFFLFFEEE